MGIYARIYSMKENTLRRIAPLFRFRHFKFYALSLFLFNGFLWLFAYSIFIKSGQGLIFLHSSVDFGVGLIGEAKQVFVIPILGLVFFLFNFLISFLFSGLKDFKFLSHLLFSAVFVAHIFLGVSLISIYLINFR